MRLHSESQTHCQDNKWAAKELSTFCFMLPDEGLNLEELMKLMMKLLKKLMYRLAPTTEGEGIPGTAAHETSGAEGAG